MTAAVSRDQRHTRNHPCEVCGGHAELPQGKGGRCAGFTSENGEYCYCTREQFSGPLQLIEDTDPPTYRHRLSPKDCNCLGQPPDGSCRPSGKGSSPFERDPGVAPDISASGRLEATHEYGNGTRKLRFRRADGSKHCVWQSLDPAGRWLTGRTGSVNPGPDAR